MLRGNFERGTPFGDKHVDVIIDVVTDVGAVPTTSTWNAMETKICKKCNKQFPIDNFYSNGRSSTGTIKRKPKCKACEMESDSERYYNIIEEFYGSYECSVCGYNRCKAAIEFHHKNESTKDKSLSNMKHYSRDNLFKELEKCIMLCANCHREVHYGG